MAGIELMRDVGHPSSQDVPTFKQLLQTCGLLSSLTESTVAQILLCMAQTSAPSSSQLGATEALTQALTVTHVSSGTDSQTSWAWKVVIDTIKGHANNLSWPRVAELLDQPGPPVSGAKGFLVLINAYRYAAGSQLPVMALVGRPWKNAALQLSILRFAVTAPPEVFSFVDSQRRLAPVEGLQGPGVRLSTGTPNHAWLSIDLLQVLCHSVVDSALTPTLKEMVEYPLKNCPEVMLLTMAAVPHIDCMLLQREVFGLLLPMYLTNNQVNTPIVLHRLWEVNKNLVLEMLVEYFLQDHANLPRILDICQELHVLPVVLDSTPFGFSLELAATAAARGYLALEEWAAQHMKCDTLQFVTALLAFLEARTAPDGGAKPRLPEQSVKAYLSLLSTHQSDLVGDLRACYEVVLQQAVQVYPGIAAAAGVPAGVGTGPAGGTAGVQGGRPVFSEDLSRQANALYQGLFKDMDGRGVEEVLAKLQAMQSSDNAQQRELYNCLVHSLIDEFVFFSNYPDQALALTAQLYGHLLARGLLPEPVMVMALHKVLEALRSPLGTKLFMFGMQTLNILVPKAGSWGPFCQQVLAIPHLREAEPGLVARLEAAIMEAARAPAPGTGEQPAAQAARPEGLAAAEGVAAQAGTVGEQAGTAARGAAKPAGAAAQAAAPVAGAGTGPEAPAKQLKSLDDSNDIVNELESTLLAPAAQASTPKQPTLTAQVNIESLEAGDQLDAGTPRPPDPIMDRVAFIMNNLSEDNLDKMAVEIKSKVLPMYVGWLCNYLVLKRAAQEANFHQLYLKLVDKLGDKDLYRALVRTTHHYVRVLLSGDRIVREANDRALLKNLGCWLGLLTLARSKPLLHKELELKQVIIDAYQRGRLLAVLPFVSKLLECCKSSKVFTATNPLISGVLSLLTELHRMPKLKLNNVFSIELALTAFGKPHIEPTSLLTSLPRDMVSNADWTLDEGHLGRDLMAETTSTAQAQHTKAAAAQAFSQGRAPAKGPGGGQQGPGSPAMPGPGAPGLPPSPGTPGGPDAAGPLAQAAPGMRMVPGPGGVMVPADPAAAAQPQAAQGPAAGALPGGPPGAQPVPVAHGLAVEHAAFIAHICAGAVIHQSLGMITERLGLKRNVPLAMERATWELLNPVVERSVTIACYTTAELVAKDFAMDPTDGPMRKSAHLMVCSLAGQLSLVTCKEPLKMTMNAHLGSLVQGSSAGMDKAIVQSVVDMVVNDNLEACCQVFERAATEKAVREVDKLLAGSYEERARCRAQGRPFVDPATLHGRFPRDLPEGLRPRPGPTQAPLLRLYEDFARIPRTAPPLSPTPGPGGRAYSLSGEEGKDGALGPLAGAGSAGAQVLDQFLLWQGQSDSLLQKGEGAGTEEELSRALGSLVEMAGPPAPEELAPFLLNCVLRHLVAVAGQSAHAARFYVTALRELCGVVAHRGAAPALSQLWAALDDERKLNPGLVEALVRAQLLTGPELDTHLARLLTSPRAALAADTITHLAKVCIVRDRVLGYAELAASLDTLAKLAVQAKLGVGAGSLQGPGGVPPAVLAAADAQLALVEQAKRQGQVCTRPPQEIPTTVRSDKTDPPGMREQVQQAFEGWLRLVASNAGAAAYAVNPAAHGVSEMERGGMLATLNTLKNTGMFKDEALLERMLRCFIDMAVGHANTQAEQQSVRPLEASEVYLAVDGLARLLVAATVHGAGEAFLAKALSVMVAIIKRDADERGPAFNGRPHMRLLVGLMAELPGGNAPSASSAEALDTQGLRYLRCVALALHALQPLSVPGWAFCWLEVIAHRSFLPRLLLAPSAQAWPLYESLLVALLRFLEPFLRNSELNDSIRALYKGTLRLLLVLLHDFPEFLCEHHFALCDVIPTSCVQLRNLVLSAFPRSMRLPDPFTSGLKVDLLPEIREVPRCTPDPSALLDRHEALRAALDTYLATRSPAGVPSEVARAVRLGPGDAKAAGTSYNVPLINALVMYVGTAVRSIQAPSHPAAMDVFMRLLMDLDSEGRYLVLNAAANQLRYPNAHTQYFSCVLLALFGEAQAEAVREQITRVLLERLVVNRPHPWGLLITFIELIKNRRYDFWQHSFTRSTPDVERLFKSVAASCITSAASPLTQVAQAQGGAVLGQQGEPCVPADAAQAAVMGRGQAEDRLDNRSPGPDAGEAGAAAVRG